MQKKIRIALIAAIANNYAIGKNNQLLWHLPKDFQFFKKHTHNKTVIMGKNTWYSLPIKPLPLRRNIILSSSLDIETDEGVECYRNIEDIAWDSEKENMILGGASLYRHFLPYSDTLYITHVNAHPEADVFFPKIDFSEWKKIATQHHETDAKHSFAFDCTIYTRRHTHNQNRVCSSSSIEISGGAN